MSAPQRIGRYRVGELLGKGSATAVHRGFDEGEDRAVALKFIAKSAIDPEQLGHTLERLRREREAAGRVRHPNVALAYDFIETEGYACIAMELAEGEPLSARLEQVVLFELPEAWAILRQVLDGLAHCHAHGVLHRDLKPANILVAADGRVKIVDFGVARLDSSSLTQAGEVIGTPYYMAPEQCSGEPASAASDIYQVGVIAYELVTGERPFTGKPAEMLRRVLQESPADPSTLNPGVGPALDAAIRRALAKDPTQRFAGAREFAQALRLAFEVPAGLGRENGIATFVGRADARSARVLFVDDDERILNAVRAIFRNKYQVFTARSAPLALELVRRFGMHVVVSDQRMPGMSGVELLREVKELAPRTVRLLLTGYSDLAAIVGAVNEGEIFRYLRKPWDNAQLEVDIADAVAVALAEPASPTTRPGARAGRVLVIDETTDLAYGLQHLLGDAAAIEHVGSQPEAQACLETGDIGVVVADLTSVDASLGDFLVALKARQPEVLAIVVTDAPDSERVIGLINAAQIYRFLTRPLEAAELRTHVEAALRWHAMLGKSARSEGAHAASPGSGAGLIERLRGLIPRSR